MEKKFLKSFILSLTCIPMVIGIAACKSQENKGSFSFSYNNETVPETMNAELGNLFTIPLIKATDANGDDLMVSTQVFDSKKNEVRVINSKFNITDVDGYVIRFTAYDGEMNKHEVEINLTTTDTTAPSIIVNGTSGAVSLLNSYITVPEATVTDLSTPGLKATYVVEDNDGNRVNVEQNRFYADKVGTYTITYSATDKYGNVGTTKFISYCKKATILNNFDGEPSDGVYWTQFKSDISSDTEYSLDGKGVKIDIHGRLDGDTVEQWKRICVPCKKANGEFFQWEEFLEMEAVQMYVYSSEANELGLSTKVYPISVGKNFLYMPISDVISSYKIDPNQYTPSENGFFINLRYPSEGSFMVFDQFIGIYADDYVNPPVFKDLEGNKPQEKYFVDLEQDFLIPTLVATQNDQPCTMKVSVLDSKDNNVDVIDNKFKATDVNGYTIIYTATGPLGSKSLSIPLVVHNIYIPEIKVLERNATAIVGEEYTIPEAEGFNNKESHLKCTAQVFDSNGDEITIIDNKFTPTAVGNYVVKYSTSTSEGYTNEDSFNLFVLEKGSIVLADFNDVEDVKWTSYKKEKTLINDGLKLLFQNNIAWSRTCIPFITEDGSYFPLSSLTKDFDYFDIYLYSSSEIRIGLPTFAYDKMSGQLKLRFTIDDFLASLKGDPNTYTENENGFYLNLGSTPVDEYIILQSIVGHHNASYDNEVIFTNSEGGQVTNPINIKLNDEFTVPTIKAIRRAGETEMNVTYKVFDSKGEEVKVVNDKFIPTDADGYKIVYTASDSIGSTDLEVNVICTAGADILNSFEKTTDVVWSPLAISKAEGGILLTASNTSSWINFVVTLNVNYENLIKYDFIEVNLVASVALKLGLYTALHKDVSKGENHIIFTKEEIIASQEGTADPSFPTKGKQYDASGFWFQIVSLAKGETVLLQSIKGYNS